ncbi:MAG: glycosyltransferase family 2 protein [Silvanigrellaceae bacterium]|nr:glycosyltransferase family 2 protein [Silvanigrellaceae bacterium]
MSCPISAIVITKNEEKNIQRCLTSLSFVHEVILVDSGSTDGTLKIAEHFKNVQIINADWHGYSKNKQIAIDHAKNSWILWLDADEEVDIFLKQEIINSISTFNLQNISCYQIPRKTFFLGHWVKHSGWYPSFVIRLFHKERCYLNNNFLHEGVVSIDGFKILKFKNHIYHYSYHSLYQYFDKMNYYGKAGALQLVKRNKRFFWPFIILQPLWTFFKFYILKRGFLDGYIGVIVCMGAAFSNFIKYSNLFFLKKYGVVEVNEEKFKNDE